MKQNKEKIFGLIICIAILGVISYSIAINLIIDKKSIFVLAKVTKIERDPESGLLIYYQYLIDNNFYNDSYSTTSCNHAKYLMLKVSSENYGLNKVYSCDIPDCLFDDKYLGSIWKKLPSCP